MRNALLVFLLLMSASAHAETDLAEEVSRHVQQSRSGDQAIRRSAIGALISMGNPVVPFLIQELESQRVKYEADRMRVIHSLSFALGQIGDQRALPILYTLLEDEDPSVQVFAAEAICGMKDEAVIFDLMKFSLKKSKEVNEERALAVAQDFDLKSDDGPTLLMAQAALYAVPINIEGGIANIGEPIIPTVLKGLKHDDAEIRALCVGLIWGLSGDHRQYQKTAVESFIELLKDSSPLVRQSASHALASITDIRHKTGQDFGENQQKWQTWWRENKGEFR